jgi:hypothetical protein
MIITQYIIAKTSAIIPMIRSLYGPGTGVECLMIWASTAVLLSSYFYFPSKSLDRDIE